LTALLEETVAERAAESGAKPGGLAPLVNFAFVYEVKKGLSGKSLQLLHWAIDPSELWHAACRRQPQHCPSS
jgi:hypothetical protein